MQRNNYYFRAVVLHISLLFLLGVFKKSSQQNIKRLNLYEGDICRKGKGSEPNFECRRANNCDSIEENFKNQNYPDICMYDGHQPIFCCLPNITHTTILKSSSIKSVGIASDKCRHYGDLFKKMFRCDRYSEFTCLSGDCIHRGLVCDGKNDCPDGYDENETLCKTWTCNAHYYFKCANNNKCIFLSEVCNGYMDCPGGNDEDTNTCETWNCGKGNFKCKNNKCINRGLVCDGKKDCQDGSDEDPTFCKTRNCRNSEFKCRSGYCIKHDLACDGSKNCKDGSDEDATMCKTWTCDKYHQFKCKSDGICISKNQVCNSRINCEDGSDEDETMCKKWNCGNYYFKCGTNKCISPRKLCDGNNDCQDGSDEDANLCKTNTCEEYEFKCLSGYCIYKMDVCDGEINCPDGSDEDTTMCKLRTCETNSFKCANNRCIYKNKVCDGSTDCVDGSDEYTSMCNTWNCTNGYFKCDANKCIPWNNVCNGKKNCHDKSDEDATMCNTQICNEFQYKCQSGNCIHNSNVCDGKIGCKHGDDEDEIMCKARSCSKDEFKCSSDGVCIKNNTVCDGTINCLDESDEDAIMCKTWTCNKNYFKCANNKCILNVNVCDTYNDCMDGSDESTSTCKTWNCTNDYLKCGTNICIPDTHFCDGEIDCKDGSDEGPITCKNWPVLTKVFPSNGYKTNPREFAHMALLGFGETIKQVSWACGGSLISERWVLSAAHCEKSGFLELVNWVRLGDLNIVLTTDDARPTDYKIVERVIHPEYKTPSLYNDIALFRLEEDAEFSHYVWPICLNVNPLVNPTIELIATGWGRTSADGPTSDHLLKVYLHLFPENQCNDSYFWPNNRQFKKGITPENMICAFSPSTGQDTCLGDSGGPLQIKNNDFTNMYTQIGVISFGKQCGDNVNPGVYTRVSKYISWIEKIVWPIN